MSERPITTVLPEGVELVAPEDNSPYYYVAQRANQALQEYQTDATSEEIASLYGVIDGFRNDFTCGKAVRVAINGRTAFEAFDADEKVLEHIQALMRQKARPVAQ